MNALTCSNMQLTEKVSAMSPVFNPISSIIELRQYSTHSSRDEVTFLTLNYTLNCHIHALLV